MNTHIATHRFFLSVVLMISLLLPGIMLAEQTGGKSDLFGTPEHKLVYQFNQADPEYMQHVLFSIGAMLRKHGDNIHIVVVAIGPGIHILAKQPERPIPDIIRQRVSSLEAYGVTFHACGNTMKALKWTDEDMLDFTTVVEVGVNDLMELQEQGYSYISW